MIGGLTPLVKRLPAGCAVDWRDIAVVPSLRKGKDTVQTVPAEQGGADDLVTWNVKAVASGLAPAIRPAASPAGSLVPATHLISGDDPL